MNTETAIVEVKYVNPPKDGKQYGSIKGTANDSWPVKRDRIHEFAPNNKYEINFTEAANGFRNIIGIKRIVPREEIGGKTHWTQPEGALIDNRMQNPTRIDMRNPAPKKEYWQPKPTDPATAKRIFICGLINAWAHNGRIAMSVEAVADAVRIAAEAYDAMLTE